MSSNSSVCPRIGVRYRSARLNGPYDAIIIGSGMGGLTTAALLSELGWKVAVLEQHYTAGGYTHSYERHGYTWDVGLHYVGNMAPNDMPRRFMDFLSGGRMQWAPMAENYDRFYIGDKIFNAMAGKEAFRDHLVKQFPGEAHAIDSYLSLLAKLKKGLPALMLSRVLKPWQRALLGPLLRRMLPKPYSLTTAEVLSELTSNKDLIATLTGQWGDHALPPGQSSFIVHSIVAAHFLQGGYYPVGGSWRIAESIIPKIKMGGGEVFTYARVREIIVKDGSAEGVLMEDGTRIDCACVISGAGVFNTYEKLLPKQEVQRLGYDKLLKNVAPSGAHIGVYIGLKGSAEELGLPKTNYWIYPSNDHDGNTERFMKDPTASFPFVYISFPSAKDPEFEHHHPNRSTIEIVAPANFEWFAKWKDSIWGKRGADYEEAKAQWGERLMEVMYEKLPQLRGKVDYFEVSTPLSTNWFGAYSRGELYGLAHDPKRFQQDWLGPRTKIKGLWMTGQDVLSCGVAAAMLGGVMTATAIVGIRKMWPLLKSINTADSKPPEGELEQQAEGQCA